MRRRPRIIPVEKMTRNGFAHDDLLVYRPGIRLNTQLKDKLFEHKYNIALQSDLQEIRNWKG
jgi:hypothetical protein